MVVGGGLTGLWTALQAAEDGKHVVLLEGERIASGASGRNGGFCAASLTHGIGNGLARWPGELDVLERLGRENLDEMRATVAAPRDRRATGRTPARSTSPSRRTSSRGSRRRPSCCAPTAGRRS